MGWREVVGAFESPDSARVGGRDVAPARKTH